MSEDLIEGRRVRVYRNLHTGNFSVQCVKSGLVIARVAQIALQGAIFVVRPAGHAKVLAEKKKNVHAFVVGAISSAGIAKRTQVNYNPYKAAYFWTSDIGCRIDSAEQVLLVDNKIYI